MPKCPIGCGECCDEWAYVEALWEKGKKYLRRGDPCPNLGASGCVLPRNQRPKVCRDHLCNRALQAIEMLKHKGRPKLDSEDWGY